jgi:hypothetical protein
METLYGLNKFDIWRSAVLVSIENIPQLHPALSGLWSCVLCAGGVDRVLGCSLFPPANRHTITGQFDNFPALAATSSARQIERVREKSEIFMREPETRARR